MTEIEKKLMLTENKIDEIEILISSKVESETQIAKTMDEHVNVMGMRISISSILFSVSIKFYSISVILTSNAVDHSLQIGTLPPY